MAQQQMVVDGMSCGGCVASVERVLKALPGVTQVVVELASGQVTVAYSGDLSAHTLAEAVRALGFEVR